MKIPLGAGVAGRALVRHGRKANDGWLVVIRVGDGVGFRVHILGMCEPWIIRE